MKKTVYVIKSLWFAFILHVPLEPIKGKRDWLGPKGITVDM